MRYIFFVRPRGFLAIVFGLLAIFIGFGVGVAGRDGSFFLDGSADLLSEALDRANVLVIPEREDTLDVQIQLLHLIIFNIKTKCRH